MSTLDVLPRSKLSEFCLHTVNDPKRDSDQIYLVHDSAACPTCSLLGSHGAHIAVHNSCRQLTSTASLRGQCSCLYRTFHEWRSASRKSSLAHLPAAGKALAKQAPLLSQLTNLAACFKAWQSASSAVARLRRNIFLLSVWEEWQQYSAAMRCQRKDRALAAEALHRRKLLFASLKAWHAVSARAFSLEKAKAAFQAKTVKRMVRQTFFSWMQWSCEIHRHRCSLPCNQR